MSKVFDINPPYKATRIKIMWFWHQGRHLESGTGYKIKNKLTFICSIESKVIQQINNSFSTSQMKSPSFTKKKNIKQTQSLIFTMIKNKFERLLADFSKETLWARRSWQEVFKVMKSRDLQPRLLYPAKLSFRMEGHALAGVSQWMSAHL